MFFGYRLDTSVSDLGCSFTFICVLFFCGNSADNRQQDQNEIYGRRWR